MFIENPIDYERSSWCKARLTSHLIHLRHCFWIRPMCIAEFESFLKGIFLCCERVWVSLPLLPWGRKLNLDIKSHFSLHGWLNQLRQAEAPLVSLERQGSRSMRQWG